MTRAPSSAATMAALGMAMLLPSLGTSIANVALPAMAKGFAAPQPQVQWVVIAYLVAVTALIVGAGRLGDVLGRRRVLLGGIFLFTLASAAAALAPGLWPLVALRAVQGAGAAAMMALALASVGDMVPRHQTGRAMGLLGTISAVGTALGPSLGGLLVGLFGWPAVFVALAVLGGLGLAIAATLLPAETREPHRASFDLAGTAVLATALAAFALAVTHASPLPGLTPLALGVLAAAGLAGFVWIERHSPAPLVRLSLLRDPALATGLLAIGLISAVVMATLVVGPFYLTGALGLGPVAAGLAMSVGPGVAALAALPAGRLSDRIGARRVGLIGLVGVLAGSLLMTLLPGLIGLPGYLGSLALITASYALFQTANNSAVMQPAPQDRRGVISALLGLSRNLGLILGASAMGAVFAHARAAGFLWQPPSGEAGLRATFALAAGLAGVALIASARTHRQALPQRA